MNVGVGYLVDAKVRLDLGRNVAKVVNPFGKVRLRERQYIRGDGPELVRIRHGDHKRTYAVKARLVPLVLDVLGDLLSFRYVFLMGSPHARLIRLALLPDGLLCLGLSTGLLCLRYLDLQLLFEVVYLLPLCPVLFLLLLRELIRPDDVLVLDNHVDGVVLRVPIVVDGTECAA